MATSDSVWYVNSVTYAALTAWAAGVAKTVGQVVRPTAPAVASERVFMCIVAGTTHATTEPTWTNTRGAKTTDNTVTWQEMTGAAGVNGDMTNTLTWSAYKAITTATLGQVIKNNAATHLFACTTAGTQGASEPSFNTTTGATTADNTATWTCIGAVNAFAGGANPHARVRNALASGWFANGNRVYIGDNSAETQAAAYTISSGQTNLPLYLLSHDHTTNYPPTDADLSTTPSATITVTGAFGISFGSASGAWFHGIKFQAGSGAVSNGITFDGGGFQRFVNCSLEKLGTSGAGGAFSFTNWHIVEWINTTIKLGSTSDSIRASFAKWIWRDTPGGILAAGSSVPTRLLLHNLTSGQTNGFRLENLDLSSVTNTLVTFHTSNFGNAQGPSLIKNCKLANGVVVVEAPFNANDGPVDVVRCSDTAGNLVTSRYMYGAVQSLETTIIRTGGASDGTTGFSWKVVTTSGNVWQQPFDMTPMAVMNTTVNQSVTATVEGIWGGGAVPNNDDIWIEAVYLGSSSTPLGTRVSGGKASVIASNAALSSSSATWGGSTTAFKMTVSFTPQQVGPVEIYVRVARASATFYVDPKVTLS